MAGLTGVGQGADGPGADPNLDPDLEPGAALAHAFRDEWGRVLATLIRVTGDWDLAEECTQESFAAAAAHWPRDGVPRRPGAWLTTTARHRAVDRLRRATAEAAKLRELGRLTVGVVRSGDDGLVDGGRDGGIEDDRLRLIFTCCHPALPLESRVALTLRTLGGLTVAELARAFGTSEAAMAKRLVRARRKIVHAGIPYRVPPDHLLGERLSGVLAVLYLMYSEGYAATSGPGLVRAALSGEAIRLLRVLAALMPSEPEVGGLLALVLLHDARRATRVDDAGDLVLLEDQDRRRWDAGQIAEGGRVLTAANGLAGRAGRPGPYQLQAAIAACHATAARAADTDWARIARLYAELGRVAPSPYVELNRAVAVAMDQGPAAGLALVDAVERAGTLAGFHLVPATQADLLRRDGRPAEAARRYAEALATVTNDAERRYLRRRLAEVAPPPR